VEIPHSIICAHCGDTLEQHKIEETDAVRFQAEVRETTAALGSGGGKLSAPPKYIKLLNYYSPIMQGRRHELFLDVDDAQLYLGLWWPTVINSYHKDLVVEADPLDYMVSPVGLKVVQELL
jgi:hypothetical protein